MSIAGPLLQWFDQYGRVDLPWKANKDPYRIWVSEIMLQQTQVKTVIPYYLRFMQTCPDVQALAEATEDQVLGLWSGLGYYSRARNLHKAAHRIQVLHGGVFPDTVKAVEALPGIGRSTAAAILSMAFDQQHAILDGNVKRVLTRYHAIAGWPGQGKVLKRLWHKARQHTPQHRVADYTQAIMDLGATVCNRSKPECSICPLNASCEARLSGRTAQFPAPRPRKDKPVKRVAMLVATTVDGQVLLVKRPPTGIWASLWGLPEVEPEQLDRQWCQRVVGLEVNALQWHEPFRHTFTHYHLDISPVVARVVEIQGHVAEGGDRHWHAPAAPLPGGVAAPVMRLLGMAADAVGAE